MSDVLSIRSYHHVYGVEFVDDGVMTLQAQLRPADHIIADKNVLRLHPAVERSLEGFSKTVVTPTEQAKSYDALAPVIQGLIDRGFSRIDRLVAIGGGIVQDITAFVASIFLRGVDWLFFPTNLLAQCDSCIGSKTSINFGQYKNQLGGFFPPRAVFIDVRFLKTLSRRDICSGLGEMMHYFLVNSGEDLTWAEQMIEPTLRSEDVLQSMIRRSLGIKKEMIERDEFDQGPRNVFNYGHSFGHALESTTAYRIPHGVAVAYGMDLANLISEARGLVSMDMRNRIRALLERIWAEIPLPAVDVDRYLTALARDKKNEGQEIKVILTRGPGTMFKTALALNEETRALIQRFFGDRLYSKSL